ncbi:MAG: T9SS type A sorting domain-containing protein [Bacteroidota bacterium]
MKKFTTFFSFIFLCFSFCVVGQAEFIKHFEGHLDMRVLIKLEDKILFRQDNWNSSNAPRGFWITDGSSSGTFEIDYNGDLSNIIHLKDSLLYFLDNDKLKRMNTNSYEFQNQLVGLNNETEAYYWKNDSIVLYIPNTEFPLRIYNLSTDELIPLTSISSGIVPTKFFSLGNQFLFQVETDLWVSDGTSTGTQKILQGIDYEFTSLNISKGILSNGILIFEANSSIYGIEPWRTDGTSGGTFLLKDIAEGINQNLGLPHHSRPSNFNIVNNKVCFTARQTSHGDLILFETDGSSQGTIAKMNISKDYDLFHIREVSWFKNQLLVLGTNYINGHEYWITNDSLNELSLLKDIRKGAAPFLSGWLSHHYQTSSSDNYFYFPADDGVYGKELWRTDGTTAGTRLVEDIHPRATSAEAIPFESLGDEFLFRVYNQSGGFDLYKINENAALVPPSPYSRSHDWFVSMGSHNYYHVGGDINTRSYLDGIAIDNENNIFVSGDYNNRFLALFDSENIIEPLFDWGGYTWDFVASFDENGKYRWGKSVGEYGFAVEKQIATDNEGNLLVAGRILERGGFDSLTIDAANGHMYLAKYNNDGHLLWIKQGDIGKYAEIYQMKIDQDGSILVAGDFNGFSARFGNYTITANSDPGFFLVKYDKDGNELWAKNLSYPYEEGDLPGEVKSLLIGQNNQIYTILCTGGYNWSSSCKFSDWNIVLVNYSPDGEFRWVKEFVSDDLTFVTEASINDLDEIFMVGRFRGEFELGDFTLETECEKSGSFLAKISSRGEVIKVQSFLPENIHLYDVEFDKKGNYYLAGREVSMEISNHPTYDVHPFKNTSNHTFVKKYDKYDQQLEERYFKKDHSDTFDSNPNIVIGNDNKVILSDTYTFNFDTISNSARDRSQHILLMKFGMENESFYQNDGQLEEYNITIAPNPSENIIRIFSPDDDFQNANIQLFDAAGRLIAVEPDSFSYGFKTVDISQLAEGVYFVAIRLGDKVVTKKVVKM